MGTNIYANSRLELELEFEECPYCHQNTATQFECITSATGAWDIVKYSCLSCSRQYIQNIRERIPRPILIRASSDDGVYEYTKESELWRNRLNYKVAENSKEREVKKKTCGECGSLMSMGCEYSWENKFLGEFSISCNENEYFYCSCGDELIALSLLERVEQEEQKRVEQLLLNSVECDFEKYKNELISCNELGRVLGISRQAVSKNRRIKTLIYKVVINNETFYWRESAVLFKKHGDGRFDLMIRKTENKKLKSEVKDE